MTTNDVTSVTTGDILSREEVERIAFVAYVVQPYAAQMLAHDAALRSRLAATEALAVLLTRLADSAYQWAGRDVPHGLVSEIDSAKARLAVVLHG